MDHDNLGADGDAVYAALMATHEGLNEAESHALNARLVLMMANQIGDADVLEKLFLAARSYRESTPQ
ncbi:DUF2783 domain-containing protein [Pseudaestuariivita rosea]|uniref:DUF2783 domain-containing protein n=1 Tax=Pseudaestuariivita rosea TaxID=2763263 RepID=UPI001ABACECB|nr:DUF2783 domain-containing protein [Pseudaestuariivita rosea]